MQLHFKASDSFFDLARNTQRMIDSLRTLLGGFFFAAWLTTQRTVVPQTLRRNQAMTDAALGELTVQHLPRRAMIEGFFAPINMGRFPFAGAANFARLRVDSMHFAQSFWPVMGHIGGPLWPMELHNKVTWCVRHRRRFI